MWGRLARPTRYGGEAELGLQTGRAGQGKSLALLDEAAPGAQGLIFSLPRQLTTFVGRERELADVAAALDEHQLVTVCGPGGAGKTRLALAAAERLRERCPDGVFIVELADVADPHLVASCVASVVGVRER